MKEIKINSMEQLTDREKLILIVLENQKQTVSDLKEKTNINKIHLFKTLDNMLNNNLIDKQGNKYIINK